MNGGNWWYNMMKMDTELLLANNNLKSASEKLGRIHTSVADLQTEMRNHSSEFYYRLALLAGGVLSLDITFIGYLSSKSAALQYSELLFLSWMFLIIGLIGALYRNHYNLDMGHYQTTNTLNKARLEEYKAMLVLMELNPSQFVNIKTKKDLQEQVDIYKKNITTIEKAIQHNEKKEKMNSRSWVIAQGMAHMGFVVGLILTTVFASLNLPINLDFTIVSFLTEMNK